MNELEKLTHNLLKKAAEIDAKIISVVLFGSLAKEDTDKSSDIDIIVVVDDTTTDSQISTLKRYLYSVEEELGLRNTSNSLWNKIQRGLDRIGAQYKSMFVVREDDFVNSRPAAIFHTESKLDGVILDNPFLRNDIGFKNILLSAKTSYGKNLMSDLQKVTPVQRRQMAQNRITYSMLNLYALLIFPFSKNATKYSLSATKWALHSCYFIRTSDPGNLSKEISYFQKKYKSSVLKDLPKLRKNYHQSFRYVWKAQGFIWKVFSDTLNELDYPVKIV